MTASASRHLVDPELAPLLELFPTFALSDESLAAARERMPPPPVDPEADAAIETVRRAISGPAGAPEVVVFCHRPRSASGPLPGILHVHGGGYVMGSAESMAALHKPLALKLGCAIVAVEYRIAPETRFPGAVEDC